MHACKFLLVGGFPMVVQSLFMDYHIHQLEWWKSDEQSGSNDIPKY